MILVSWRYNSLRARACQPTAGFTSNRPQTEMKYHPARLVVRLSSSAAVVGYPDRNFCYKSVSTQPTMLGWQRSHIMTDNSTPTGERTSSASHSTSSKHEALIRVAIGPRLICFSWLHIPQHSLDVQCISPICFLSFSLSLCLSLCVHEAMGYGQKSLTLMWWCHQLLSGFLFNDHLPRVSH